MIQKFQEKKSLLNLTRSVKFSSKLVSTKSQFTIRKKRHQTLQCSILIAVISRLQYTNSLLSTNFTNTSFSKHRQTPNYLHCRYFKTTIIQNIFGHASKQPNIGSGTYYRKFFLSRAPRNQLRGDMRKFSVKLRRVKTRRATVAPVKVDFAAKSRNLSFLMVDGHRWVSSTPFGIPLRLPVQFQNRGSSPFIIYK